MLCVDSLVWRLRELHAPKACCRPSADWMLQCGIPRVGHQVFGNRITYLTKKIHLLVGSYFLKMNYDELWSTGSRIYISMTHPRFIPQHPVRFNSWGFPRAHGFCPSCHWRRPLSCAYFFFFGHIRFLRPGSGWANVSWDGKTKFNNTNAKPLNQPARISNGWNSLRDLAIWRWWCEPVITQVWDWTFWTTPSHRTGNPTLWTYPITLVSGSLELI